MVAVKQAKKKEWKTLDLEIPMAEGVSAKYEDYTLTVTGPKGELSRRLKYPRVSIEVKGNNIVVGTKHFSQREKKIMFTYRAHINNMMTGVTEGFEYNLKVVYAKFPISASLSGNKFELKNLLGEKVPRTLSIPEDVKLEVKGQDLIVTGVDKERVGQVAASLESLTKVTNLDRRVVQDGIFITKKPHRSYV